MPGVKNQHYVPRFYLKSFTDDSGYLSVVRRDAGGLKPIFLTKPENVCAENYLYEIRRRGFQGDDGFIEKGVIEDKLGKTESKLAPAYQSLLNCLDRGELPKNKDGVDLAIELVAFLIARNPMWLNVVRGAACNRSKELEATGRYLNGNVVCADLTGLDGELKPAVEFLYLDTVLFERYKGTPIYSLIDLFRDMDCRFCVAPEAPNSLPLRCRRAWHGQMNTMQILASFIFRSAPVTLLYFIVGRQMAEVSTLSMRQTLRLII